MATDDDTNPNPDIKSLREAAETGRAAQVELAGARREMMFLRAGIDLDTKLGKMLYKTWEGDDVAALKAEAAELGITGGAPTPPPLAPELDNTNVIGQQATRQSLAGGIAAGAFTPETRDPIVSALEDFHTDRLKGMSRENAGLVAVDKIISAAAGGDKRALFDPEDWQPAYRG